MEEWKMTPVATCEALVNSMPKRVKAVANQYRYLINLWVKYMNIINHKAL